MHQLTLYKLDLFVAMKLGNLKGFSFNVAFFPPRFEKLGFYCTFVLKYIYIFTTISNFSLKKETVGTHPFRLGASKSFF